MNNLQTALKFVRKEFTSVYPSTDESKLDGTEWTCFQVAEKVLSTEDLVAWMEKKTPKHLQLVKAFNPIGYERIEWELEQQLKEVKKRLR